MRATTATALVYRPFGLQCQQSRILSWAYEPLTPPIPGGAHGGTMRIDEGELRQGSAKWLDWRRSGIGGSEIYQLACFADILAAAWRRPGLARLKPATPPPAWVEPPGMLAARKLGRLPEKTANFHMRRGKRLEPIAREAAEQHYRLTFPPFCVYPDSDPAVRVSLDGFNDETGTLIEIKAPCAPWHAIPDYLEYQTAYQAQALRLEARDNRLVRAVTALTIREGAAPDEPTEVKAWRPRLWQDQAFCMGLARLATEFHARHIRDGEPVPNGCRVAATKFSPSAKTGCQKLTRARTRSKTPAKGRKRGLF